MRVGGCGGRMDHIRGRRMLTGLMMFGMKNVRKALRVCLDATPGRRRKRLARYFDGK